MIVRHDGAGFEIKYKTSVYFFMRRVTLRVVLRLWYADNLDF